MTMAIEWIAVDGSNRIVAEAYDPESETVYVRFPNGIEWQYSACPPQTWEAFTALGQSRGQYIAQVLNFKPNSRYAG
jgi:KTSC domain